MSNMSQSWVRLFLRYPLAGAAFFIALGVIIAVLEAQKSLVAGIFAGVCILFGALFLFAPDKLHELFKSYL